MAIRAQKTAVAPYAGREITIITTLNDDTHYVDKQQLYKIQPMATSNRIAVQGIYYRSEYDWRIVVHPYNRRAAYYWDADPNTARAIVGESVYNTATFILTEYDYVEEGQPPHETTTAVNSAPDFPYADGTYSFSFSTNIPVFMTEQAAINYINAATDDLAASLVVGALNYKESDYTPDTHEYWLSNRRGNAQVTRNSYEELEAGNWQSLKFLANEQPVLYYSDEDYSLTLIAPGVVSSYAMEAPSDDITIDQSLWTPEVLVYDGLWYGQPVERMHYVGDTLPDGQYTLGFEWATNIYIFKDRESAEHAIETGDYSGAGNYDKVNEGDYTPPTFGDEEQETEFGNGADTSPFMQTYVLSRNSLINVAQQWYSTDPVTLKDLLSGLEMFGDRPSEAIAGITMYPFDVNRILTTSEQHYIYFGTYQMNVNFPVYKAVNLRSNAFLDCGTIFLAPLQYNYRDFAPYTQLDVWLPYIGWKRVDIDLLLGKQVNVRYYVDVHTRSCTAVIIANGVFITQYNGTIGVGLPAVASDFQSYANAMGNAILGGGQGITTGARAAFNAVGTASTIGGAALGVGAGALTVAANTAAMINKLDHVGQPADHMRVTGGFTSGLGTYLPQSVLWRYSIYEALEPDNFNAICGRPSAAGGTVSQFSGFLSCKSVKLNTSRMLDEEANEIYTLLKGGIYI